MVTSLALRGGCHLLIDFARQLTPYSALLNMIPSSAEVMHLAFQFGESHEPCAVVNWQFRMSRSGKHLGPVGGPEVP